MCVCVGGKALRLKGVRVGGGDEEIGLKARQCCFSSPAEPSGPWDGMGWGCTLYGGAQTECVSTLIYCNLGGRNERNRVGGGGVSMHVGGQD